MYQLTCISRESCSRFAITGASMPLTAEPLSQSPLCQIVSSRFFYKMGSDAIVSDQRVTPDLQSPNCSAFGAHRRDQQHQRFPDLNQCSARAPRARV